MLLLSSRSTAARRFFLYFCNYIYNLLFSRDREKLLPAQHSTSIPSKNLEVDQQHRAAAEAGSSSSVEAESAAESSAASGVEAKVDSTLLHDDATRRLVDTLSIEAMLKMSMR